MNDWIGDFLGWLVGVEGLRPQDIRGVRVFFDGGAASTGLFVLAGIIATIIAVFAARREQYNLVRWQRGVLGTLRVTALLGLLLILFLPMVKFSYVQHSRYSMALLVDDSDSLNLEDVRMKERDLEVAARVMFDAEQLQRYGPVAGWPAARVEQVRKLSRARLLRRVFGSAAGEPLRAMLKEFDVHAYRVADDTTPVRLGKSSDDLLAPLVSLRYDGKATAVGSGIRHAMDAYHGRAPYALVYIGDGSSNQGPSIESAATSLAAAGTQLHMVLVGIEQAKDVQVEYVDANDIFFKEDKAVFRVVLSQSGCDGERCDLLLKRNGRVVKTESVELRGPSQTVRMEYVPTDVTASGRRDTYEVTAEGVADEVDTSNNAKSKKTKTIDGKLKVLYVENYPRWEWRVMRDMMLRDRRVGEGNYHTLLIQADERAMKRHTYYLREFPDANKLKEYHALIIGDVDARFFLPKDIQAINSFVGEWGGGLLMLAGDRFNPGSYTGEVNRPIQEMMPVLYHRSRPATSEDEVEQPLAKGFLLQVTPYASSYGFTAFDPAPRKNQRIWTEFGSFYWHAEVRKLHPMGVPLVVHGSRKDEQGRRPLPLVAARRYGKGRVTFVGIDETWRFRKEVGDVYHRTFWAQVVQYLGVSLLSGATRRIDLELDRKQCTMEEKVTVEAQVFDRDYKPLREPEVTVQYHNPAGEAGELTLKRVGDEGIYRADFRPAEEGDYAFSIEDRFADDKAKLERYLNVREPNVERDNPTVNAERLGRIARLTGGQVWQLDQLDGLRKALSGHTRKTPRSIQKPLWNTWLALLILCLCLTTEWVLRKRWNLR